MRAMMAGRQDPHTLHDGHDHIHHAGCGHTAVPHGDHLDYVHDGHRHSAHGDHWDECRLRAWGSVIRSTRQRAMVTAAVAASAEFRSAQEIYAELRGRGETVGLTTVYRHLQALAQAGEVDTLRTAEGEALYRRCTATGHHHHLVCRKCRRTVEVDGAEVEEWAGRVAAQAGFRDIVRQVEVLGTCAHCVDEEG